MLLLRLQMHRYRPVTGSAPCIQRLAASGALLVGKSNLHEIGVGMTGLNTRHGTTRNPYDPRCYTGGSSSGSAAAVSSGLCPFALGEHACCTVSTIPAGLKEMALRPCQRPLRHRAPRERLLHFKLTPPSIILCILKRTCMHAQALAAAAQCAVPLALCGIVGQRPVAGRTPA